MEEWGVPQGHLSVSDELARPACGGTGPSRLEGGHGADILVKTLARGFRGDAYLRKAARRKEEKPEGRGTAEKHPAGPGSWR